MTLDNIELFQELPGYKAILKSVLKSQIQLLLEQLSEHTGEESIILTASVHDGLLSHLGSETGKGFMTGRDDLKSQFLGFCLKSHHNKKQSTNDKRPSPYQRPDSSKRPGSASKTPSKRVRSDDAVKQKFGVEDGKGGIGIDEVPPLEDMSAMSGVRNKEITVTDEDGRTVMKVERNENSDNGSLSPLFTTDSALPPALEQRHTQSSANHSDSILDNDDSNYDNDDTTNATSIKIEPITENEMELEITGVELGGNNKSEGDKSWNQSYVTGATSGDDSINQGADTSGYMGLDLTLPLKRTRRTITPGPHPICHPCPYCGRVFKQKAVLARHIRRHTGEKPFQCPVCSAAFPRKATLKYHMDCRHPGIPLNEFALPYTYS